MASTDSGRHDEHVGDQTNTSSGEPTPPLHWIWALLVVIAFFAAMCFLLRDCGAPKPVTGVDLQEQARQSTPPGVEKVIRDLGKFRTKSLPTHVALNIPEFGIESTLLAFIEDRNRPVDKTTWFDFDRLVFESGSATLHPESNEQLNNIAEILKAFPRVKVKIGGYTDDVGDSLANQKLSLDRATNVMKQLNALGVHQQRMVAEGYGELHPIADNTIAEGRALNRRIALRVTAK